jgi:NAD+ synthase
VNGEIVRRHLVRTLRQAVRDAGFRRGIVGLTGRPEEAVVAALAAQALGREQVRTAVLVDPEEEGDPAARARGAATHLGVHTEEIPLDAHLDALLDAAPEANARRRRGYLARVRTALLVDRSVAHRALVLGTASKSEILLGRTHLHGEDACSVAPIADLYATEVAELADRLDLPAEIRGPAPKVELPETSAQGGVLEPTWSSIDPLLRRMHDERLRKRQLLSLGYERADIHRVATALRRSRHRRRGPVTPLVGPSPA